MKMIRLILILLLIPTIYSAEKVLKLATCEWPPYVGKDLADMGITTQIVREVLEKEGFKLEISFMPWARVLKVVESGEYDIAYPAYYTKERTKVYHYSDSFLDAPVHICGLKINPIKYEGLSSLREFKIGVVNGYVNSPEFDAADFLNKKKANDDKLNLLKLMAKRVDLISIDKFTAIHISETSVPKVKNQLLFYQPALEKKSIHILISKNKSNGEDLVNLFNKGFDQFKVSDQYKKIIKCVGN